MDFTFVSHLRDCPLDLSVHVWFGFLIYKKRTISGKFFLVTYSGKGTSHTVKERLSHNGKISDGCIHISQSWYSQK